MSETITKFMGEPLTRREIDIAREGFVRGGYAMAGGPGSNAVRRVLLGDMARKEFPYPKVTRPRFLSDPHTMGGHNGWIVEKGVLLRCVLSISGERDTVDLNHDVDTANRSWWIATPDRVAVWHDLFTTPAEEVDSE